MDGPGVEHLARALGMNYAYVPFTIHPATRRDMGVAVLSPWPLDEPRKVLLPVEHRIRKIRRSAVVATLHLPALSVRVYAVHLETVFGASSGQRRNQARAILDDVARWEGPAVIAGDFNGTSGAAEVAKSGFVWLTRDVHNTEWLFDLDHILVRGLCAAMDPPARKAPRAEQVSDHAPVWSVVRPCPA
jgi:endonuclease/exonuclease/phosphatase family metal-dependent hydrolase